jgi:hypothetical protein
MIRDEDGALTGYIYIDLKNSDYGGFAIRGDLGLPVVAMPVLRFRSTSPEPGIAKSVV